MAKRSGLHPPSLRAIAHELILGWLLTFGLLTWLEFRLALGALVSGSLAFWTSAGLSPRLLTMLEAGILRVFTSL